MFKLTVSENARNWLVVIAMCISVFAVSYTTTATLNSLPMLANDLHMSPNALQWVLSSYSLATGAFIIVGGQLGDLFNYRRAFYIGVVIFTIASVVIAFANSGLWMIMGRTIQGLGAAFITPLTLSLIKINFEGERVKSAIAIWAATLSLGFSIGPVFGGIFTTLLSWRAIFWLSLVIILVGATLLMITPVKAKQSADSKTIRLDFIGLLLLIIGLVPLLLGLSEGNGWGWANVYTWGCMLGGIILLVIFFFVEIKTESPLVHFQHFKQRLFAVALVGQACTIMLNLAFLYFFNLYVQTPALLHYSPIDAGLAILPMSILVFLVSFAAPHLVKRYGYRCPLTLGFIIEAIGFYLLYKTPLSATYLDLWPALVLIGLSTGLLFASFSGLAMTSFPPEHTGQASGILGTDMYVAASMGTAISMIFYLNAGRHTLQQGLQALDGLSAQAKELIEGALIGHTMPLKTLVTQLQPMYREQVIQLAKLASLHSFHAAMLYAVVVALIGAVVCGVFINKNSTT